MNILYDVAISLLNRPYKWGGDDPMGGFDCSGVIQEILASVGADPPGDQTAQHLFNWFSKPVNHVGNALQLGALVFYGESPSNITHVAMCLSDQLMIEAGGGGPNVRSPQDAEKSNAYVRIRPIRTGIQGVFLPEYLHCTPYI